MNSQYEFCFMNKSQIELKEISLNCLTNLQCLLNNILNNKEYTLQNLKDVIYLSKWIAEEDIK